jgi:hypothetical protein
MVGAMTFAEYIVTRSVPGAGTTADFQEFLAVVAGMPEISTRKVTPRYLLFTASAADAELLRGRFEDRYRISPNSALEIQVDLRQVGSRIPFIDQEGASP